MLDLDGPGWVVREALGDTWMWYLDKPGVGLNNTAGAAGAAAATPGWWPATVPGSVVTALARAGELPDPYVARNSRAAEWTGTRSWVFRRAVTLPELAPGRLVVIELDGIDPSGSLWWDGERLGSVDGLYHRLRAAVPAHLAGAGDHRVAVVVDPLPATEPQVGRTERVRVHRPRVTEGWDFCPRFPHQGIWRSSRIVIDRVHLATVSVRVERALGGEWLITAAGTLEVSDDSTARIEIDCADADGAVIATATVDVDGAAGSRELHARLVVEQPRLWWPHGLGEPATHTVRIRTARGRALWHGIVGFRTATLEANTGASADALPYTLVVNGRRVPLLGWNWAPAEAQYGATPAGKVAHLVDLAARSGARLLRVWGGGLLETNEFYDACDHAGVLVWQEFSQSSSGIQSAPATDEAFVAMMRREVASVVPPRTHHPSLLIWGGGNELDDGAPLDERRSPVLAALRDDVARFDPGRAWLPSSPSGPVASPGATPAAGAQHDVHGPWEHQGLTAQQESADAGAYLAHSEFGVEGMANRRLLEHLVPAERRWPADRSNAVYRHLGEWWDNEPHVQACFGGRLTDIGRLRDASQYLQASGLAYAVEADRRRWPRCSMVLPWQLAESYPNAWCTAAVDHLGDPKPAYHAVARAFAPNRVTLRFATTAWGGRDEAAAELWLWSEDGIAPGSFVTARLLDTSGAVRAERDWLVREPVREPFAVGVLRCGLASLPADAAVVWEATWSAPTGQVIDREVQVATTGADLSPLLDLPPARLDILLYREGRSPTAVRAVIQHVTGPAVIGMRLLDGRPVDSAGWLVADGDPRPLLPGESRELHAFWRAGPEGPLTLATWNAGTHPGLCAAPGP